MLEKLCDKIISYFYNSINRYEILLTEDIELAPEQTEVIQINQNPLAQCFNCHEMDQLEKGERCEHRFCKTCLHTNSQCPVCLRFLKIHNKELTGMCYCCKLTKSNIKVIRISFPENKKKIGNEIISGEKGFYYCFECTEDFLKQPVFI